MNSFVDNTPRADDVVPTELAETLVAAMSTMLSLAARVARNKDPEIPATHTRLDDVRLLASEEGCWYRCMLIPIGQEVYDVCTKYHSRGLSEATETARQAYQRIEKAYSEGEKLAIMAFCELHKEHKPMTRAQNDGIGLFLTGKAAEVWGSDLPAHAIAMTDDDVWHAIVRDPKTGCFRNVTFYSEEVC